MSPLEAPLRKKLIALLKLVFSAVLLYFIFTRIPFREILGILSKAQPGYILLALLFFTGSKIISAFRLNAYFHSLNIPLSQLSNLKLYLLGMFYNLFLPGGIGGDAYKGYVIKQRFAIRTRRVVAVLLLDRLSGLLLLFLFACILGLLTTHPTLQPVRWLLPGGIILSVFLFWVVNRRFFPYVLAVFWKSLGLSAIVQSAQLLSVLFLLLALSVQDHMLLYLIIFLVSSIVAVIPLTIGGIGSRELVFFYGALWLGLDEATSIGISMAFFLITALVSLCGLGYHFRKPRLILREGE